MLRRQRSVELDAQEDVRASEAAESFAAASKDSSATQQMLFTFAERSHWPQFQDLLASISSSSAEESGELMTATDQAVASYEAIVSATLATMKERVAKPSAEAFIEDTFVSPALKYCIFVGHVATDLDSIAGAMGAAALFGGVAAKSEDELNGEIMYALREVAELDEPVLYDTIPGITSPPHNGDAGEPMMLLSSESVQSESTSALFSVRR
jgi:hypothetical protein